MSSKEYVPWVEKYRPNNIESIVLSDVNRTIIDSIIKLNYFPNILLYGPPGTGKTTTIINLINKYHKLNGCDGKALLIHLNASDDRGIEIIRNQINMFVKSYPLLNKGMKFVVFDEVDYMTKNAQQALHNMLEHIPCNVKICLICNYISKIELSLLSEFIHIRFNKLPEKDIINFLLIIAKEEKLLHMNKHNLKSIQEYYKNDIRSMINFMQVNKKSRKTNLIIDENVMKEIIKIFSNEKSFVKLNNKIKYYSSKYTIEQQILIKYILKYIIKDLKINDKKILNLLELINHSKNGIKNVNNYCILELYNFFKL